MSGPLTTHNPLKVAINKKTKNLSIDSILNNALRGYVDKVEKPKCQHCPKECKLEVEVETPPDAFIVIVDREELNPMERQHTKKPMQLT